MRCLPLWRVIQEIEEMPATHSVRVTEYEGKYLVSFQIPIPKGLRTPEEDET